MSFNISNLLTFETVCAEGSSARHFCVQLQGFCIDSGHPIGASSGVSFAFISRTDCCEFSYCNSYGLVMLLATLYYDRYVIA